MIKLFLLSFTLISCGSYHHDKTDIKRHVPRHQGTVGGNGVDGIDGRNGRDGEGCSVTSYDDGAIIDCPDGTAAEIYHGNDSQVVQIKGDKGDKGETGSQGKQGVPGDSGENGQGTAGVDGSVGERGPKGDTGERGEAGAVGEKGERGIDGDDGANGEGCTVYEIDSRNARIECPDGTYVDFQTKGKK